MSGPGRGRVVRWQQAARVAASAFGPNYRAIRKHERARTLATFTRFIAWCYIIGTGFFTISTVVNDFTNRSVSVALPVMSFWPRLPAGERIVAGTTATVTGGGFTSATVDASGLDTATRAWLAGSTLLQGITVIVIAAVVAALCSTMLRRDPFQPSIARGVRITGITVIVGGLGWQICSAVAGSLASAQVLHFSAAELAPAVKPDARSLGELTTIVGFPQPGTAFQVEFWPIWVGLALLALSAVFRYGTQLKRDSDGLV